jgi:hypothetical protein
LKHKNTQPLYIFNKENPQNSEPQNDPRRGLDFIALTNLKRSQSHTNSELLNLLTNPTSALKSKLQRFFAIH